MLDCVQEDKAPGDLQPGRAEPCRHVLQAARAHSSCQRAGEPRCGLLLAHYFWSTCTAALPQQRPLTCLKLYTDPDKEGRKVSC